MTRLGDQIVLWRDKEGQVHALEDRCPHRGARLSLGWNLGGSVACWYHGIEIDGGGTVTKVPAVSNCPLEGQKCVKSYPVEEHAGAIFLWFGDDAHKEPAPLVLPEELVGEEYASFLCMSNWKCNYQYAIDNVMDPMHGAYLHATSHSMAEGDKQADMRVRKTETGLMFEKVGQRDVNFDWVELGETGCLWMRLAIPYKKKFGPGGNFGIIGFARSGRRKQLPGLLLAYPQGVGLAARCMALPVSQPSGRSALGRAGAGPLCPRKHGAECTRARIPLSARRRHDARAPHVAPACAAGFCGTGRASRASCHGRRRSQQQDIAMHDANAARAALNGRRVLVTGGARGLGAAFVRSLVQAGAQVVFGDVLHDEGRALAAIAVEAKAMRCTYLPLDLADPASIRQFVASGGGATRRSRRADQQRGDHQLGRQVRRRVVGRHVGRRDERQRARHLADEHRGVAVSA